ncbi:E3 ubiquitin-protein ligase RNF181-like [Rhopilema esculentum]|uniref:E3 ubiquitin-protein ligase RNF181-like n=1 Tax=Rhopilema esculentum TaxID=499914 RepID=UPI0031E2370B
MASYFEEHSSDSFTEDDERMNFLLELARILRRVLREQNVQLELPIEEMLTEHLTTPPASREFISNLPLAMNIGEKCPICLVEFTEDELGKKLPCNHCFHSDCIIPWLKKTNSCPVCRREFPTDNAAYEEYRKEVARENNVDHIHRLEELHGSMFS